MMGPKPHTQLDADLAAGMGMPDNGPKLMSMWGLSVDIRFEFDVEWASKCPSSYWIFVNF